MYDITTEPGYPLMRVCRKHLQPYDTVPNKEGHTQRCSCTRERGEPTWDRYDFNEWLTICACCTSEALASGHRFFPFLCSECAAMRNENRKSDRPLNIPIGRHSLMNGVGVAGTDADKPGVVERFLEDLDGLFTNIAVLHEWQRRRLRSLIDSDEDPLLVDVLAGGAERWTKAEAFDALCVWWVDPEAP